MTLGPCPKSIESETAPLARSFGDYKNRFKRLGRNQVLPRKEGTLAQAPGSWFLSHAGANLDVY